MSTEQDLMGYGMPPFLAGLLGLTPQALTGAGTAQATATLITSRWVQCTAASSNTGVILPAAKVGEPYFVTSVGGTATKVYPQTSGTINGGAANAGVTFSATPATAIFIQSASVTWWTIPGTPGN